MAIVTIMPSGIKLNIVPGTILLKAALDAQLAWTHTCGGQARCTTCAYNVLAGGDNLSPISKLEIHQLTARKGRHVLMQKMRLACQTTIKGDCTVYKLLGEKMQTTDNFD